MLRITFSRGVRLTCNPHAGRPKGQGLRPWRHRAGATSEAKTEAVDHGVFPKHGFADRSQDRPHILSMCILREESHCECMTSWTTNLDDNEPATVFAGGFVLGLLAVF